MVNRQDLFLRTIAQKTQISNKFDLQLRTAAQKGIIPIVKIPASVVQRIENIIVLLGFNQTVNKLPSNISLLTFGKYFNQPVNKLPSNIPLPFGKYFNQFEWW